jgi:hypothetical protein
MANPINRIVKRNKPAEAEREEVNPVMALKS